MAQETDTPQGKAAPASRLVVKWQTPTDEALGMVRVAGALVSRRIAEPAQVAIVAPTRLWANNLKAACDSCGVKASLCIPHRALAEQLPPVPENTGLKGLSLVRRLGWVRDPRMAHALLHVQGSESADEVYALVKEQLARPTVPHYTEYIPIVLSDFDDLSFDYLFMVACVKGLVPAQESRESRERFAKTVASGRKRTCASYFVKAPLEMAQATGLHYARVKSENGQRMAMAQPSPYLEEAGIWRPTTTGGQALLRTYGLN